MSNSIKLSTPFGHIEYAPKYKEGYNHLDSFFAGLFDNSVKGIQSYLSTGNKKDLLFPYKTLVLIEKLNDSFYHKEIGFANKSMPENELIKKQAIALDTLVSSLEGTEIANQRENMKMTIEFLLDLKKIYLN